MIGRRKKQQAIQRSPHLDRQKQTTFRYSSNRSQTERPTSRHDPRSADKETCLKEKLLNIFKKVPYVAGAALTLVVVIYLSLLTAQPKVVVQNGQGPLRHGAPYAKVASGMADNLGSRSKFTLNRQKISDQLQSQFPELRTVNVKTPLFANRAVIEVEVARPELILRSGTDSYALDNRGMALINVSEHRPAFKTDDMPVVTDQSNTQIEVGKQALTSAHVAFILEIARQSQAKELVIDTINLGAGAGELLVRYSGLPYSVKYNLNEDPRKSFGTFFATKEYLERENSQLDEYIDVRISERAYVK